MSVRVTIVKEYLRNINIKIKPVFYFYLLRYTKAPSKAFFCRQTDRQKSPVSRITAYKKILFHKNRSHFFSRCSAL